MGVMIAMIIKNHMKRKELNFNKLGLTNKRSEFVFNSLKGLYFKEPMTEEAAKEEFIKQLNTKGYVPLNIKTEPIQNHYKTGTFDPNRYGQIGAWCCYFGKRNAPKIGFLEDDTRVIKLHPYYK